MRVAKLLSTSVTAAALAFSMLASAIPASAASGFHAAYFSESSFLSLSQGQTGQLSVGYSNTGDLGWTKGSSTSQASLQTRNGDTSLSTAGWASGWVSSTVYANQANDLVAPGQVGFFVYNVVVPANAAQGEQKFTGIPWAAGAAMEDYGYYQSVTVAPSLIKIDSSSPASPSSTTTPALTGSGAGDTKAVTILDGTTSVGTGTSTSAGAFTITTSALAAGSHSLTATTSTQTSVAFTYVVDTTAPKVSSAAAANLGVVNVTFNKNMNCASLGTGTFTIKDIGANTIAKTLPTTTDTANGILTITGSGTSTSGSGTADCLVGKLTITGGNLTNGTQYTVTVGAGSTDAAGNAVDTTANTGTFVAAQTAAPTLSSAVYRSATLVRFTFSAPMNAVAATAAGWGTSIANAANYTADSTAGTAFGATCVVGPTGGPYTRADCTLAGGTGFTTASHTFTVANATDVAGNTMTSASVAVAYPPTTARPTVSSVTSPNRTQIVVQYAPNSLANMGVAGVGDCRLLANYALNDSAGAATTLLAGAAAPTCSSTTNKATITLAAGLAMTASATYSLVISNVTDSFGNALNPTPTTTAFVAPAALTPAVSSTSTPTLSSLNPCPAGATGAAATGGPCNQTVFTVTYNEPMAASALTGGNYTLGANTFGSLAAANVAVNAGCVAGTTDGTAAGFTADATATSVTCTLSTPIQAGSYTLTITGGAGGVLARDTTALATATVTTTLTFSDSTRPTATSVGTASQGATTANIQVNFSEIMNVSGGATTTTSALNPANYKLDNVTGSTSTWTIVCGTVTAGTGAVNPTAVCNSIAITITGGPIRSQAVPHTLTITGITDITAGNAINPSPTSLAFNAT